MMDGPIRFTEAMLFSGAHQIRISGLLKEDVPSDAVINLAAKVFNAMRRAEPEVIKWGK